MSKLAALTLAEASAKLRAGTLQALGYADALLAHIESTDGPIGAWAHLNADTARSEATMTAASAAPRATSPPSSE